MLSHLLGYYSPLLAGLQQKEISGIMTNLWQVDRVKARWTLLASAYTIIRDRKGKANAPLNSFLNLIAPFLGIVKPSEYLLDWEIVSGRNGENILRRIPDERLTRPYWWGPFYWDYSEQDIIDRCYEYGYLNVQDGDTIKMPGNENVLSSVSSTIQIENTNLTAGKSGQPQSTMAGFDMSLAAYSPAALDFLLNKIQDTNLAKHGRQLSEEDLWAEFIPGYSNLVYDPFEFDEHDAFEIGSHRPCDTFDVTQWVHSGIFES